MCTVIIKLHFNIQALHFQMYSGLKAEIFKHSHVLELDSVPIPC